MNYADQQVIDMVNAPWERQKQLLARSRAAKRKRQRIAKEKAHRAELINKVLRIVVIGELIMIALATGFLIAVR